MWGLHGVALTMIAMLTIVFVGTYAYNVGKHACVYGWTHGVAAIEIIFYNHFKLGMTLAIIGGGMWGGAP